MSPTFLQLGSNVLVSAVGALLAGYFGVRFGISRLRSERAFDRTLGWYEEMISALDRAIWALEPLFADNLPGPPMSSNPVFVEFKESLIAVRTTASRMVIYARPAGASSVLSVVKRIYALPRSEENGQPLPLSIYENTLQELKDALQFAVSELSDEVRTHLGLAPFEFTSLGKTEMRFQALRANRDAER